MAGRRRQPSSIDKLPEEIRELIGKLRENDKFTIDQILEHLKGLDVDVSRSAIGRHVKTMAEISERMAQSRAMATALTARFGDEPDNRVARLNRELVQGIVMTTLTASEEDEDGNIRPVTFNPEENLQLARTLQALASAEKIDTDRQLVLRRELAKEAAKAVDRVAAREGGMSKDTIAAIKREILGIAS